MLFSIIKALKLSLNLKPLFDSMFIETNPIPVKTAASLMQLCDNEIRLPLCNMIPENLKILNDLLKDYKLI